MPITTHRTSSTRHSTFYRACGPADGPLVIMTHGWPELSISWRHQLVFLGNLGYRAIAPDMRGYGGSSLYDTKGAYAQTEIVQDMIELIDSLGREKAVWIGHDWGSPVAWNVALHHPDRVSARKRSDPADTAEFEAIILAREAIEESLEADYGTTTGGETAVEELAANRACEICQRPFGLGFRRHHCRNCGKIFCNTCSSERASVSGSKRSKRVCKWCKLKLAPTGFNRLSLDSDVDAVGVGVGGIVANIMHNICSNRTSYSVQVKVYDAVMWYSDSSGKLNVRR